MLPALPSESSTVLNRNSSTIIGRQPSFATVTSAELSLTELPTANAIYRNKYNRQSSRWRGLNTKPKKARPADRMLLTLGP